jgi:hypothetical protein
MPQLFTNNAWSFLNGGINNVTTSIALTAGTGARFPNPTGGDFFLLTLIGLDGNAVENSWEIVKVTARATDTLTVVRAQEGTTAVTWASGTRVELRLTAAQANSFVTLTDAQALTNKTMTGLRETRNALAANNIDLTVGNIFTKTISGTTTLTVSNVPASGTAASFILDLTNGGSAAITWWAGIKWPGGAVPVLTASGRDVLGFYTHDGGTIWTGLVLGKDVK